MATRLVVAVVVCATFARGRAAAAEGDAPPADAAATKAAARTCFDRGLAASNDQRLIDAVAEFERAYALWPDFHVLYNIGKVRAALGRSVGAVDAYRGYLAGNAAEIDAGRRREVEDAIARAEARVATLTVHVSADGAEVRLDGRLLGTSPLASAVRVDEGHHTIEAFLPGAPGELRELELAGAAATEVQLAPAAPKLAPPASIISPPSPELVRPALVQPPPHEPTRRSRALGYGLVGAGLVATVVGAVLAYDGATDANAARARLVQASMPAPPALPDVDKYDAAKRTYDDAKTKNQLGWALVAAGGVALVSGGALAFVWAGSAAGLRGAW